MRTLSILGSTGSVGCATLEILRRVRGQGDIRIALLSAHRQAALLARQALEFRPQAVALGDETGLPELRTALKGTGIEIIAGEAALVNAAQVPADITMVAVVGACGLEATLIAARAGRVILFANKECLVCGGTLVTDTVRTHGATLLPIDSEHSALFQLLLRNGREGLDRVAITCSGGPLWALSAEQMTKVAREQVLTHPVWSMGKKITVDSATMMNKGLEIIEASYLFDLPEAMIDVVIHPQTYVHALAMYDNGGVFAHLGVPDMSIPISYGLCWPDGDPMPVPGLDLTCAMHWDFQPPDPIRFPALNLARQALRDGGSAPIILNAANEVAVAAFLEEKISYAHIVPLVDKVYEAISPHCVTTLQDVLEVDETARRVARETLSDKANG
ncbi:MAG: 1-deoxy-D-xylulose-5-phosphate reductoisomerase [Pseudomonadota bacterium]